MRAELLEEPELQFGNARHVDPRFGLLELGPPDGAAAAAPRTISVGVVGTEATIDGVVSWLKRCRKPIPGRTDARQPNLFPPFRGFLHGVGFDCELRFDQRHQRAIPGRVLRHLRPITCGSARSLRTPSIELLQVVAGADGGEGQPQLHDVVKARAMVPCRCSTCVQRHTTRRRSASRTR
jgi:hypothetical protein